LTYQAMKTIAHDTPLRISTPVMNSSIGRTYLAGISEDKTNISILLSNFDAPNTDYNLTLTNLPWNTTYTIVQYCIDETHHLEITNTTTQTTSPYTRIDTLKTNSVHFYRLTNSSVAPGEGPPVANIPLLLRFKILDPLTRILAILLVLLILS